jgi:RES domain
MPADTLLWRVHKQARSVTSFNPAGANPLFGGGRFDATSMNSYPFLYAAAEQQTALLETLVRGIPFDDKGHRHIRRVAIKGVRITALRPTRDLTLVALRTHADLAAVCQDEWLVHADPSCYPQTRHWGHWLRAQAPWADGFIWPSRRDLGRESLILFGDRCGSWELKEISESAIDLDDGDGAQWLNKCLASFRISVRPSAKPT